LPMLIMFGLHPSHLENHPLPMLIMFGLHLLTRSEVILLTDGTTKGMTDRTNDHITPPALAE